MENPSQTANNEFKQYVFNFSDYDYPLVEITNDDGNTQLVDAEGQLSFHF